MPAACCGLRPVGTPLPRPALTAASSSGAPFEGHRKVGPCQSRAADPPSACFPRPARCQKARDKPVVLPVRGELRTGAILSAEKLVNVATQRCIDTLSGCTPMVRTAGLGCKRQCASAGRPSTWRCEQPTSSRCARQRSHLQVPSLETVLARRRMHCSASGRDARVRRGAVHRPRLVVCAHGMCGALRTRREDSWPRRGWVPSRRRARPTAVPARVTTYIPSTVGYTLLSLERDTA